MDIGIVKDGLGATLVSLLSAAAAACSADLHCDCIAFILEMATVNIAFILCGEMIYCFLRMAGTVQLHSV